MIQAIFYKEWIKRVGMVAGNSFYDRDHRIFHASYWPYHCHTGNRSFMGSDGPEGCYSLLICCNLSLYLSVSCLLPYRFFPEMQRKCLKLTLHLPYSQKKMVMSMLAYGVLALVTCFAMSFIMMGVYLPQHFTSELVQRVLLSAAPWFFAGFAGYLLVSWICLEPTWKRRVLNLIIAALIFRVYFLAPGAEAYNSFLPCLTLYTLLAASLSWISVVRFKAGKQD